MRKFLTPFNINFYDAKEAYRELEEIDWTIKTKMQNGDEVYFYCSAPIKKILMKGIVTKSSVDFEDMIEDSKFYKNQKDIKINDNSKYVRIKLLEIFSEEKSDLLTFYNLRENGLKGNIQICQMLDKNKELYDYINDIDTVY